MPKVLYSSKYGAIVECQWVPEMGKTEETDAEHVENSVCARCGIYTDATLRNKTLWNETGGTQAFKLMCMNPKSPYLEPMKQKLRETGKL